MIIVPIAYPRGAYGICKRKGKSNFRVRLACGARYGYKIYIWRANTLYIDFLTYVLVIYPLRGRTGMLGGLISAVDLMHLMLYQPH